MPVAWGAGRAALEARARAAHTRTARRDGRVQLLVLHSSDSETDSLRRARAGDPTIAIGRGVTAEKPELEGLVTTATYAQTQPSAKHKERRGKQQHGIG